MERIICSGARRHPDRAPRDDRESPDRPYVRRFRKHVRGVAHLLAERTLRAAGLPASASPVNCISSAPAESGMAHLVNQRMGKRQSMRRKSESSQLLLLVRCAILDNELEKIFRTWFPLFRIAASSD
jgi:hypothetical protein